MEKNSIKRRELKGAAPLDNRVSPWWPLILFIGFIVLFISIILTATARFIKSFFKQKKSVKGKLVLITGSGRGLGRGLAIALSKLGAHIACVDINTENNEETVRLIRKSGGTAQAFTCNVAKSEQIEILKRDVNAKMGSVDILVNNAALLMAHKISDMTDKDIRAMYEVNLMGPVFLSRALLCDMIERNNGHIVTMSSAGAMNNAIFLSLYCSTKSGISRFFECIRVELDNMKNNKIKITTIHPIFVNTSADYASWFNTFFPILEEDYVVKQTVDAILYEKESVAIPASFHITKVFDALFGSYVSNYLFYLLKDQIHPPNRKDREELPYTSIVDDTTSS